MEKIDAHAVEPSQRLKADRARVAENHQSTETMYRSGEAPVPAMATETIGHDKVTPFDRDAQAVAVYDANAVRTIA